MLRMIGVSVLCCVTSLVYSASGGVNDFSPSSCSLKEVPQGAPGTGKVRNVHGECLYNRFDEKFFYQFDWDPPLESGTQIPVTRYRVAVQYSESRRICFQLPSTSRSVEFNETVGFQPGKVFYYAVTAQPVQRDHDGSLSMEMHMAFTCPRSPIVKPLGNLVIPAGTNVSFRCDFIQDPFPRAKISWFFSDDKKYCKELVHLMQHGAATRGIVLSKDGFVLHILAATRQHVGCYALNVDNGVGKQWVRGYLDIEKPPPEAKNSIWATLGPIFLLLTVLLIVGALIFASYRCLTRRFASHNDDRLLTPNF